ncbi:hypothetical protein ABZ502_15905 [Streptomyces abikoensis]|uniref:Uncharacterized protein n=1 Tax=Streptomyces triculaminicus TaxID=2816232 RepID=A0A939FTR5_9ACTN|nr:hypothetical protein [Streptomyces triculaminicus]MBO0656526.1 hypothetical protein [Streptomyces triculaminicus]
MTRRCAHAPCGAPISADADQRTRYCSDAHRKAAARARKAVATASKSRLEPVSGDAERYPALRAVWDVVAAQIVAEGVTVPGSSGVPVAHPLLRFLGPLDAALSAHEKATDATTPTDPKEAARAAAMAALEDYRRGE